MFCPYFQFVCKSQSHWLGAVATVYSVKPTFAIGKRPKADLGTCASFCVAALQKQTLRLLPTNCTPVIRAVFGRSYTIRYQDVAGMVDIYAASPALLTVIGIDADGFIAARERVLERWPDGTRPATLEQSLALIEAELGRTIGAEDGLRDVWTQGSGNAILAPVTMAAGLRGRMDVGAEAGLVARRGRQPQRVVGKLLK